VLKDGMCAVANTVITAIGEFAVGQWHFIS